MLNADQRQASPSSHLTSEGHNPAIALYEQVFRKQEKKIDEPEKEEDVSKQEVGIGKKPGVPNKK